MIARNLDALGDRFTVCSSARCVRQWIHSLRQYGTFSINVHSICGYFVR